MIKLILIIVVSQKLSPFYNKDPRTSTLNLAFTEHITNALIKAREEKLRVEASIPRKLEDGWDPMIKIYLNDFSCYALCDVGASTLYGLVILLLLIKLDLCIMPSLKA